MKQYRSKGYEIHTTAKFLQDPNTRKLVLAEGRLVAIVAKRYGKNREAIANILCDKLNAGNCQSNYIQAIISLVKIIGMEIPSREDGSPSFKNPESYRIWNEVDTLSTEMLLDSDIDPEQIEKEFFERQNKGQSD